MAELKCSVCQMPWPPSDSCVCPFCDAHFCSSCVLTTVPKDPFCPNCKAFFSNVEEQLLKNQPSRLMRNLADRQVLVSCPNCPGRCWQGPRSQLGFHLDECPHGPNFDAAISSHPSSACSSPGSERWNLQEIRESLCPIDQCSPLEDPAQVPCCRRFFCAKCLKAALDVKEQCPLCRATLTFDQRIVFSCPSLPWDEQPATTPRPPPPSPASDAPQHVVFAPSHKQKPILKGAFIFAIAILLLLFFIWPGAVSLRNDPMNADNCTLSTVQQNPSFAPALYAAFPPNQTCEAPIQASCPAQNFESFEICESNVAIVEGTIGYESLEVVGFAVLLLVILLTEARIRKVPTL